MFVNIYKLHRICSVDESNAIVHQSLPRDAQNSPHVHYGIAK